MGQTMIVGVVTTLVGMGVVFSVLILLSFTTWLLNKIVDAMDSSSQKKQDAAAAKVAAPVVASTPTPAPAATKGVNPQVVAAITAAIVSAMGTPATNLKFTAIRRVGGSNLPWAAAGSADIMANRQRFTEGGNR